ncbi:HAD family hydrolase [Acinetobacter sp. WZC-1]|uniref:HAD family hydrolase n=1 Tax=Acinetobacter sp. WZC-1 TaxID=3459034 RepID=UPI00403DDD57
MSHLSVDQVIIFDLDRTIFDWDRVQQFARQQVNQLLAGHYIDADNFWQRYDVIQPQLWQRVQDGKITIEAFRRLRYVRPLEKMGVDVQLADQLNACFVEHALNTALFCEGATELLDWLLSQPVQLVLLTNGPSDGQRQKIRNLQLDRWFKHYFISEETGHSKPAPAAFMQICQQLNVVPAQCLMVGDDRALDIAAAMQSGMAVYWVRPPGGVTADEHLHIRQGSLSELKHVLQRRLKIHPEFNFH